MGKTMFLSLVIFLIGVMLGILLQRFFPIGSFLQRIGLRDYLPISRIITQSGMVRITREWDVPAEERGNLQIFILIGQSNMSGRGNLKSPQIPDPLPGIYTFNKDYRWYPAKEPLGTMPIEPDWIATDGGTGVGPGLVFANELVKAQPRIKIGLVPCARGASTIKEWQADASQNSLYGACLKRIKAASTYGKVAGVLFSQGESDADDPTKYPERVLSAEDWDLQFESFVRSLREDLHAPDLPIVFAQLGNYRGKLFLPNWELVRQRQAAVQIPWVVMINSGDLPLGEDAHFDTETQVEIGKRFAEEYLRLTDKH